MTHFLGISTGSSSISAGSQLFFQNFQGFTRLVAKSFENLTWICSKLRIFATGNGNWVQKCFKTKLKLIFQNFPGFTLGPWQKVGENGLRKWQNCKKTEAELDFLRKIKFLKASPQYFGKKLRNFSNFKPNKQNFFSQKQKSREFKRFFRPPSNFPRKSRFYCVFMPQYFQNSSQISKFFFFLEAKIQRM